MADIAMLVAEEYERRVKSSGKDVMELDLGSCVSFWAKRVKKGVSHERIEALKKVLEPKSKIGVEASSGFFSA